MKRFLRIFIPLLLTMVLIISLGWYFFQFDQELTRDILISQARRMDDRGNHSMATWFYKMAYRQSGNDESIALELAEQYHSMGNYTKAEYTLSNAIADGGSVDLYVALCKLYVEQNKLLDAVNMLDNVANPVIKAQLELQRPDPVSASHDPGYYNQYITLSFTAPYSNIYLTTDGTYPSTQATPYSLPISLEAGETVITALAVGQNGLVSPLSVLSYTVAGVIEEVVINDPGLDRVIRAQLGVNSEHILYSNELWGITNLEIPYDTKDLSDLSKLPFLARLTMESLTFESLSPLSTLNSLEELVLSNMTVSSQNLQTIAALPKLNSLTLYQCSLSGITPLAQATGLTYLNLSGNTIRDLSALEKLSELKELRLNHNAVTDLSSLSGLSRLEVLDLSYNSITTPAPLSGCVQLRQLSLSNNTLTDLEGLTRLTSLEKLDLSFTGLTDISVLAVNTALTDLDISNNNLTDISALKTLTSLTSLNFSYNEVSQLPEFNKDCPLVTIKGSNNQLTSLDQLSYLLSLNYVKMDHNPQLTSAYPLQSCFALVEVSVYGTGIHDVAALKDMGVIVLYSPIPTVPDPPEEGQLPDDEMPEDELSDDEI